jgi:hypothetical protein
MILPYNVAQYNKLLWIQKALFTLIKGNIMWKHLEDINETYFEHMRFAERCGLRMMLAGFACVLHGIFPGIFVTTASDALKKLDAEIYQRKQKAKSSSSDVSLFDGK